MKEERAARLRQARAAAGYETSKEAAEAFGWVYVTYNAHENAGRGMRADVAERYATAFRVDAQWLLYGKGKGPQGVQVKVDEWAPEKPANGNRFSADTQNWSGELNSKRFQRFARPLIDDILGDEALVDFISLPQKKKLSAKEIDAKIDEFFDGQTRECRDWLADGRESSPEIAVTSHLTQFLLLMLGIVASLVRPDQRLEYSLWKKAALQTAQLLLESQARHKSG